MSRSPSTRKLPPGKRRVSRRGITLILVAGVLAVLAALATGFYSMTLSQTRSATRYADSVRAELLCRAGIEHTLAQLREQVFKRTESVSDNWYTVDYLRGAKKRISFAANLANNGRDDDGDNKIDNVEERDLPFSMALSSTAGDVSDRFTVTVTDAASKINVNAGDNLGVILDNLCRVIGPPLAAADLDALQPRRWADEGATTGNYDNGNNSDDKAGNLNLYYWLYNESGALVWDGVKKKSLQGRPKQKADGTYMYGDGYAIAGYRARMGRFSNIEDVKNALSYVERTKNNAPEHPLEQMELEVKFQALRDYITVDSWVDTNTVCVGKFEFVQGASSGSYDLAIDRDKSWVIDDLENDPTNLRGSLRGCYVSIVNGHGAGQFRRIKTNGLDWIELEEGFTVPPGPTSSYMIIAKPDATPDPYDPKSGLAPDRLAFAPDGDLKDDPLIDYTIRPLCIHRAPVNINTASDKVLTALFMGLNVQHGHPMSIGTDVDRTKLVPLSLKPPPVAPGETDWKSQEYRDRGMEPFLLTLRGLKRLPADSGKLVFDRSIEPYQKLLSGDGQNIEYLNNFGRVDPNGDPKMMNEAHELALRVISARQRRVNPANNEFVASDTDPLSGDKSGFKGYERGAFRSWDDFYYRVVRPWDDAEERYNDPKKISVARMLMAHFNSNTNILKFNPNIEWIDRWGRNFTEMEPVMIYDDGANEPAWRDYSPWPASMASDGMWNVQLANAGKRRGSYYARSMRYKSDELIDKTDMNRSTTEFSFDSAGIFEVQSVGHVISRRETQAERKIVALVKLYDVWRESTQAQFVRGVFSEAANGDPGTKAWNVKGANHPGDYSGRVTRDSRNGLTGPARRLALDTLPEPLAPLRAQITGAQLTDAVDPEASMGRDAWGQPKAAGQPDVVANRVMPAYYDGQIVLATNTSSYDPNGDDEDTFLASFDGDLDTGTCVGNGREQAKAPTDRRVRVLDTMSLLGALNDKEVDFDPKKPLPWPKGKGGTDYDFFAVKSANTMMRALDPEKYWENVTCRQGDLRQDGVYLGNVGISGNDATLKYMVDQNWPLSSANQGTVSMWFKPNWHVTDGQEHEFFNAVGIGDGYTARGNHLRKMGRFTGIIRQGVAGASNGGGGGANNDLGCHTEDDQDIDLIADMHGGTRSVNASQRVSPSFRTQPFRWSFTGMVMRYEHRLASWPWPNRTHDDGTDEVGYYATGGGNNVRNEDNLKNVFRPFMDTARNPEGKNWSSKWMHSKVTGSPSRKTDIGKNMAIAQEAAWAYADGATTGKWVFGANNLNFNSVKWLYRSVPIDGTQAVVDEYKLSKKMWDTDRIADEMTTSRYYLPSNPSDRNACPTFQSQTLLQSLKGSERTASDEEVTVARVSWNCFTPRFMHENRELQNKRKRGENIGDTGKAASVEQVEYRGPFDYIQYNHDILPRATTIDNRPGEAVLAGNAPAMINANGRTVNPLGCDRPSPEHYLPSKQHHATKGVEVEVLKDPDMKAGSGDEVVLDKTYTNPDENNAIGDVKNPIRVKTSQLRYRVRFRYPVDPLVNQVYGEANNTVDPTRQLLLDTPVFDDISVTYFTRPRILSFREVNE